MCVCLLFVTITARQEMELQSKSAPEYLGPLLLAYLGAVASTMLLQEPLKVALVAIVSPQMLPSLSLIQQSKAREAVRLLLRAVLGSIYFALRLI